MLNLVLKRTVGVIAEKERQEYSLPSKGQLGFSYKETFILPQVVIVSFFGEKFNGQNPLVVYVIFITKTRT